MQKRCQGYGRGGRPALGAPGCRVHGFDKIEDCFAVVGGHRQEDFGPREVDGNGNCVPEGLAQAGARVGEGRDDGGATYLCMYLMAFDAGSF